MEKQRIKFFAETLGLSPFRLRYKEALIAIRGEEDVPPSRWGLSSLKQLHPSKSHKLWRGKYLVERKVIISNLFNHLQTPIENGWSVEKTQTLDYRGKHLTYNSHNGTDFAIPIGSMVTTAAAGEVVAVLSQFNRGGLKIFIDHGDGLMTCYAHLARSLVKAGDILKRAEPIAISGYSGLDGAVTFPFGIPHVHFNVWLNGEPIDPFPYSSNQTLWINGNTPGPADNDVGSFQPSVYNEERMQAAIDACLTQSARQRICSQPSVKLKAAHTIIEMNYYPTRFTKRINVYAKEYARAPRLDLPFSIKQFDDVVFLDEL